MKTESITKRTYTAPQMRVYEVRRQCGVLLSSGVDATRNGYGDAIEDDWQ